MPVIGNENKIYNGIREVRNILVDTKYGDDNNLCYAYEILQDLLDTMEG